MNRIALVGSSSTGKSTVFNILQSSLRYYKFISESTRTVARYGFPINEDGTDLTQLAISSFHLKSLLIDQDVILDRCYMDLVAYSRCISSISKPVLSYIEDTWQDVKNKYSLYIYFPIEFESVEDGVRSVNESWRQKVDEEFKIICSDIQVPVIHVNGSPIERADQILNYMLINHL
jgi:nicotinamide riboside kinase